MSRPVRVQVITVSDRSARGEREDLSGPLLTGLLAAGGCVVTPVLVVDDAEDHVRAALLAVIGGDPDVVITTGGTGLGPRDNAPEAARSVIDTEVPGIAEALRADGVRRGVPTAVLSRGVAGLAGRTLVITVAGSTGAVRDAAEVLLPLLPHAVAQLAGEDHTQG